MFLNVDITNVLSESLRSVRGMKGLVSLQKKGLRLNLVAFQPRILEFCPQVQIKTKKKSSPQIGTDFGRNFGSP